MYSIETAPLCKIVEQSDNLSLHGDFKELGDRKCPREHPLSEYLVIDKFLHLASDTSSLYQIGTITHGDIAFKIM